MLGLVDTAILGHLENAMYLAAVAVGSSILSFLYWGFGFLRMGTTGLAAQARGAGNHVGNKLIIAQSMVLGATIALLVIILSPVLLTIGLKLIAPPAGAETLAATYTQIRIFSAPAVLINYGIIGWFIGQQNTRWPLLITVFTNVLNLGLDFLLIIGLNMNSEGAAIATLIAEYAGCGLALLMLKKHLAQIPGQLPLPLLLQWKNYHDLLMVNRHLFIRTLVLLASFSFFTAQGAQQGEIVLAANTIIMNLLMLTAFGLDGFAHAAEALAGDAVGQKNRKFFLSTCYHCGLWSLLTAVIFTLIFACFGPMLVSLLTSISEVKTQAIRYLPWLIALPLISVWSYLFDGIFIGATQSSAMQTTMLQSVILVYLPVWFFTQSWGNHGLWLALLSFNGARGITLAFYFFRYNRQRKWWPHNSEHFAD